MIQEENERGREALHRGIWTVADRLRGSMDSWDFKNYVLGAMFYRYLSENLCSFVTERFGRSYETLSDDAARLLRPQILTEKGFFLLPSELFRTVCARAHTESLSQTLAGAFHEIEHAADGLPSGQKFSGLFGDFDLSGSKLGDTPEKREERLRALLEGVAQMQLDDVRCHGIDAFGDAYEYLMTMYARNAGKSGGEFFTPSEVSRLLTQLGTVGKTGISSVYDPACGSGSLLLQAVKVLGKNGVRDGFFGQDLNATTSRLCRINLILHDIEPDRFHIACEDTLTHPAFRDAAPFELIVSNPPYSIRWAGDQDPKLREDPRFAPAGALAPRSKADLAFVLHSLHCLSEDGTAAIVCFPGVLYRGGSEKTIRKYLVDGNYLDCVISLPPNLFFGTTVATCILVLRKNRRDRAIQFIDASGEFVRMPNHNRLTEEHIRKIVEIYAHRQEVPDFSHLAAYDEVVGQDYQLSVSSYVCSVTPREEVDLELLEQSLEKTVVKEEILRGRIARIMEELKQTDWNC